MESKKPKTGREANRLKSLLFMQAKLASSSN